MTNPKGEQRNPSAPGKHAAMLRCLLLIVCICSCLQAAEPWSFTIPASPAVTHSIAVNPAQLQLQDELDLAWQWEPGKADDIAWLECCLVTADERFFVSAGTLNLRPGSGRFRLPLNGGSWGGNDGMLTADALAGVIAIWLRVNGNDSSAPLVGSVSLHRGASTERAVILHPGLVDRGPWRECHFRLSGPPAETVELILANGRRIPCFAHQDLAAHAGLTRARGAAHWVARLLAREQLTPGWCIAVTSPDTWQSDAGPQLRVHPGSPPNPPGPSFPLPETSGRNGYLTSFNTGDSGQRSWRELPPALAPILSWNQDWTGFRGTRSVSHLQAAKLDHALTTSHVEAIDLLPQTIFDQQGTFRFGLTPWHADQSGPWRSPVDVFKHPEALAELAQHAREVYARSRADGSIDHWQISAQLLANDDQQEQRLSMLLDTLRELIETYDDRPLYISHPQAVPYQAPADVAMSLGDFETDTDGWFIQGPKGERNTGRGIRLTNTASHGRRSLALTLQSNEHGPDCAIMRQLDHNAFDWDQVSFETHFTGGGLLQFFAWVTDANHHWYQQRLAYVTGNNGFQRVLIDFSPHADWRPVGHDQPWSPDSQRRLRRIGITAFHHGREAGGKEVLIDHIQVHAWPREAIPPLIIEELDTARDTHSCFATLERRFSLLPQASDPYDPDVADIVVAVTRPDGSRFEHPAFWYVPQTISYHQRRGEEVKPNGPGEWRLRFTPDSEGMWRYQVRARILHHGKWIEQEGQQHRLDVGPAAASSLARVRQSNDPRWWEKATGEWFYPIGINLRSPGDDRQNPVLTATRQKRDSASWERLGLRAYEDWFDDMQANGMNYARVWMCPWWCGLEWTSEWDEFGGLGWYNQANAARLDRVMELAADHHIYLQLEIQNHGMTAPRVDTQWVESPYNAANGGPCATPKDYFLSEEAWEYHRKRLRYTIARYGHASHLVAWVLSSELEFTGAWWAEAMGAREGDPDGHSPTTQRWVERNLAWFKANDHHGAGVSLHFSHPWRGKRMWRIPGLAFNNSNAYSGFKSMGQLGGARAGLGSIMKIYLEDHFPPWKLKRPTIIGEWGGHWSEKDAATLAAELHCGLWLQAVLPYGGNVGFWWWLWVDADERWPEYRNIANFIAGDDPRGQNFMPNRPPVATGTARAYAFGMSGNNQHRYYAWLAGLDRRYDAQRKGDAGVAHVETGKANSRWRVERWNCQTGTVNGTAVIAADANGLLELPLGQLAPDAAFKLDQVDRSTPLETPAWLSEN